MGYIQGRAIGLKYECLQQVVPFGELWPCFFWVVYYAGLILPHDISGNSAYGYLSTLLVLAMYKSVQIHNEPLLQQFP